MIQLQCASFCTSFHNRNKQPQPYKTEAAINNFFQYICSVTMINIVKKYLRGKIHLLNTLNKCSENSQSQAQNKYIVKNRLLQNNYWWLLPLFRYVLHTKLPFFQKLTSYPHIFFHLKHFLWKGPLTVKVRKKKSIRFGATSVFVLRFLQIQVIFLQKLLK